MIENTVRKYLRDTLSTAAYLEEPPSPEREYLIIEKTGSGDSEHIKRATVAVQSYAETMLGAAELSHSVKAAMEQLVTLAHVSRCECLGDYNFTDPKTKRYRYQAVFRIVYKE